MGEEKMPKACNDQKVLAEIGMINNLDILYRDEQNLGCSLKNHEILRNQMLELGMDTSKYDGELMSYIVTYHSRQLNEMQSFRDN